MTYSEPSNPGSNEPTDAGAGTPSTDRATRPVGSDEYPSTAVVLAVAAATGADPIELSPPLHEFVDPDALDALAGGGDRRIAFDAYGCRVVVDGDVVDVHRSAGPHGIGDA